MLLSDLIDSNENITKAIVKAVLSQNHSNNNNNDNEDMEIDDGERILTHYLGNIHLNKMIINEIKNIKEDKTLLYQNENLRIGTVLTKQVNDIYDQDEFIELCKHREYLLNIIFKDISL